MASVWMRCRGWQRGRRLRAKVFRETEGFCSIARMDLKRSKVRPAPPTCCQVSQRHRWLDIQHRRRLDQSCLDIPSLHHGITGMVLMSGKDNFTSCSTTISAVHPHALYDAGTRLDSLAASAVVKTQARSHGWAAGSLRRLRRTRFR